MADHQLPTIESLAAALSLCRTAPVCITCGTDFSEGATDAVEVAANMARALREPLHVVHAANSKVRQNLPREIQESISIYAQEQLRNEVDRLRPMKIPVQTAFRVGEAETVILAEAAEEHARLLVIGGTKGRGSGRELSSRVFEQVAEAASIPALVVRDAASLLRWLRGERRLRILVGANFAAASRAALRWVDWLREIGPCDVIVAVLEPGPASPTTAEVYPPTLADDIVSENLKVHERFFRQLVQTHLGRAHVRVRFEYDLGRSDAHLIQLATYERADLLVFGTDPHGGPRRFDSHPVSRGLLRYAPFNIACVPGQPMEDSGNYPAVSNP
jgi:nucleotide-binding universal stress UspA family protein